VRTAPLEFFENRLVIAVSDQTWRRHLEELSPLMLAKINGSLDQGSVTFIEFRIDAAAVKTARKIEKAAADDIPVEPPPSLTTAADAIADENLRKHFLSAAASYLARQDRI